MAQMISNFYVVLNLIVSKKNSVIVLNDLKSDSALGRVGEIEVINRDDDDLISCVIEQWQCGENYFIPECLEKYLVSKKNGNEINEVVAHYTFAHDGQCNLEFDELFLKKASYLFNSLCITTYRSGNRD
jgi:hypothetical protein